MAGRASDLAVPAGFSSSWLPAAGRLGIEAAMKPITPITNSAGVVIDAVIK
jgi:hypothetical protein